MLFEQGDKRRVGLQIWEYGQPSQKRVRSQHDVPIALHDQLHCPVHRFQGCVLHQQAQLQGTFPTDTRIRTTAVQVSLLLSDLR